jgi:hypothetical protein
MYAVIEYNDCRKEQYFEIKRVTDDLDYAKKLAFNNAKEYIKNDYLNYRITTDVEEYDLISINESIVKYRVVEVREYKTKFKIIGTLSTIYSVIKLQNNEKKDFLEDIDEKIIINYHIDDDDD